MFLANCPSPRSDKFNIRDDNYKHSKADAQEKPQLFCQQNDDMVNPAVYEPLKAGRLKFA